MLCSIRKDTISFLDQEKKGNQEGIFQLAPWHYRKYDTAAGSWNSTCPSGLTSIWNTFGRCIFAECPEGSASQLHTNASYAPSTKQWAPAQKRISLPNTGIFLTVKK